MNVEGSQPAAFRCLSGVVATAAPDNQRNAGGAGPGLTTYRQPTVPFKVCFALTNFVWRGSGDGVMVICDVVADIFENER